MLKKFFAMLMLLQVVVGASQANAQMANVAANIALAQSQQEQGSFDAAIATYQTSVDAGHINGHLFYNLGHAYMRSGQTGHAAAAFLAAKRYLPRDPDVAANLKYVHSKSTDKLTYKVDRGLVGVLGFWLESFTVKEAAWATAIFAMLSGIWISLSFFVAPLKRVRRLAYASLLIPTIACGNLVLAHKTEQHWGAVVADKAEVLSGPGKANKVLYALKEGAPFLVTGRAAGWYRVTLSDGKKGWIRDSAGRAYGSF